MSDPTLAPIDPAVDGVTVVESKKRKRTGKDRKEAKALAEQAQARMAELIATAAKEAPAPAPAPALKPKVGDSVKTEGHGAGTAGVNAKTQADVEAAVALAAAKAAAEAAKREPESIAKRISQGLKAIHPLLKQAKTFETQRLIKKIRWARTKNEDVTELEGQNAAVSAIQLHDLALSHLRTKIVKHHLFKHHPLPEPISSALAPTSASSVASTSADAEQQAKAGNRLVSSKIVADGMKDILGWVVGDPGARLVSRPMAAKAEREKKKGKGMDEGRKRMLMDARDDDDEEEVEEGEDDDGGLGSDVDASGGGEEVSEDEDDGLDERDDEALAADAAGWESGSVDDLGVSDDEGVDEEDSDDSDAVIPSKRIRTTLPKIAPLPKSKVTATAKSKLAKSVRPEKKQQKREDITSSLFLPSLASGFTRGDSDESDPDMDFDADGSGMVGKQGAERKNRRGQRARQAIWEKKYGKNAKHVVKSLEANNVAQAENNIKNAYGKRAMTAGDAAMGAGTTRPAGRPTSTVSAKPTTTTATSSAAPRSAYVPAAAKPASATAGSSTAGASQGQGLHPSWEAARRKKQLLAAAPAAQKIVFD